MLGLGLSAMGGFCSDAANQHLFLLLRRSCGGKQMWPSRFGSAGTGAGWERSSLGRRRWQITATISSLSEERHDVIAGPGLHLILEAFSCEQPPPTFPSLSGVLRGQGHCCCGWRSAFLPRLAGGGPAPALAPRLAPRGQEGLPCAPGTSQPCPGAASGAWGRYSADLGVPVPQESDTGGEV